MMISAFLTLELSPFGLAPEATPPPRTRLEDPAAWRAFAKHALASANAADLSSIGATDQVPLSGVVASPGLDEILARTTPLKGCTDLDELLPLDGGLVFVDERGAPLLTPQCCADLSNLREWESALANSGESHWQSVWIGHPMVYVRHRSGAIQVTGLQREDGPPPADDEPPLFTLTVDELSSILAAARRERVSALPAVAGAAARLAPELPAWTVAKLLLVVDDDVTLPAAS